MAVYIQSEQLCDTGDHVFKLSVHLSVPFNGHDLGQSTWTQLKCDKFILIRGQRSMSLWFHIWPILLNTIGFITFVPNVLISGINLFEDESGLVGAGRTNSRSLPSFLSSLFYLSPVLFSLLSISLFVFSPHFSLSVFQLYHFHIFVLPSISSSHPSGKRLHYPGGLIKLQQLDAAGRFTVWFHPELSETEQDASQIDVLIPTTAITISL